MTVNKRMKLSYGSEIRSDRGLIIFNEKFIETAKNTSAIMSEELNTVLSSIKGERGK